MHIKLSFCLVMLAIAAGCGKSHLKEEAEEIFANIEVEFGKWHVEYAEPSHRVEIKLGSVKQYEPLIHEEPGTYIAGITVCKSSECVIVLPFEDEQALIHEIGHSLGLKHVDNEWDIMNPVERHHITNEIAIQQLRQHCLEVICHPIELVKVSE